MKHKSAGAVAATLALLVATYPARAADESGESMARHLAAIRHEQALAWAKQDGVELPDSVRDFFRAARDGTWTAVHTPYKAVLAECPLGSPWLFDMVNEVEGAYQQEQFWNRDLLDQFCRELLHGIPDGSVYFGSTQAGWFSVTAWTPLHRPGGVFVLAPNALTQSGYLEFLLRLYPSGIWLPNEQDLSNALKSYDAKFGSGRRPRGGGHDSFRRMEVSGQLTREIVERNTSRHACFIEKTYERSCLYPFLEPHGLIMKFTPDRQGSIPADVVTEDRLYWDEKERQLLADERFTACPAARRAYATCRSAIGGLYAARGMPEESEYAFRQAIRIYPLFDRPYYRLVQELMLPQERFADARALLQELREAGPDVHMIAEIEEWADIGDKTAYEKGQKDGFYQRVDSYIGQITKELDKRKTLQKLE